MVAPTFGQATLPFEFLTSAVAVNSIRSPGSTDPDHGSGMLIAAVLRARGFAALRATRRPPVVFSLNSITPCPSG